MRNNPLIPKSKLPNLGTTIFTQMSALAQKHQAINLSQGFPDFDGPRYLHERLAYHVAQGANQYAPMTGAQALREAIADKTAEIYGYRPDDVSDITVTAGATEALYAAITALVRAGDEVICFDPSYDSYAPAVALSGGVLKRIALTPPQLALADILRAAPEHYRALPDFYRKKRDVLVNALAQSRLKVLPCEGTYFLLIDYSAVSTLNDVEFCQWLTEEVGVAAIPLSVFCAAPFPHQLIRLCFAKQESTLLAAAERLCKL
ncbi:aminotransferase class I/II-fold pyridoxal phosphate-dependent enzyme [Salmonella enterica]|nr:aminotransferase class I/II-fold pyridoxal phosphate-dependent enzyme [Salmonella enterica]EJR3507010.1 aminotransferase class I/II-fold pyridoxal phosphate-dependent enzyme [Salmonella enterica]